ncbi:hypothetical protein SAMN05444398_10530 [Roseovarius pacificus]|uniref:SnoaL-like domain-containing protein n=1 Tax=Roseovarius pacificus TaxID=337701 RepID=A0A1M7CXT3_9RHOB|nr:hypothetical protein [Roseovarius pacificus]GGO56237.1 hypothetical protein GCM10011315_20560 [Roseovarius pacificus]SHL72052.1 hypothetical protein SAMN05444398_10530 [Roseovarius pacificus]
MKSNIYSFIAAAVMMSSPVLALDLSKEDQKILGFIVDLYTDMVEAGSFGALTSFIPHAVLDHMAAKEGITTDEMRWKAGGEMSKIGRQITLENFTIDLDSATAGQSGTGRLYTMIPTSTTIVANGARIRTQNTTLGIKEGELWFLMRIDSAEQIMVLKEVYPDLSDLVFPASSRKVLN